MSAGGPPDAAIGDRVSRRGGATSTVLVGAMVSGLATYGYQVLGVRALGEEAYAPVSVLWTVQYLAFAILLFPFEAFIASGGPGRAAKCLRWTLALTAVIGLGLWAGAGRLPGGALLLAVGGAATVVSYGAFTIARGLFAGRADTQSYAILTAGEAVVRLVCTAALVLLMGASPAGVGLLLGIGPPVVLVYLVLRGRLRRRVPGWPRRSRPPAITADAVVPGSTGSAHLAAGTAASAGVQLGLAAGPLLIPLLGGGAHEVTIAFVTLTAARVPVFLALGGLVSSRLPGLLTLHRDGRWPELVGAARRTALGGAGLALLAAPLAALLGPPVIALVFGEGTRPSWTFVALVAAGVVLASSALLVNQIVVVRERWTRLVTAWAVATAVSGAVLVLAPGDAVLRVGLALLVGQAVGLLGLVVPDSLPGARRRARAEERPLARAAAPAGPDQPS